MNADFQEVSLFLPAAGIFILITAIVVFFAFFALLYSATQTRDKMRCFVDRILVGLYLRDEVQLPSRAKFTLPNATTFAGIIAIALYQYGYIAQAITGHSNVFHDYTLLLIVIAIISDVLDGFFARALKQCSRFGELLDPARDRYFIFAVMVHMLFVSGVSLLIFIVPIIVLEVHIAAMTLTDHTKVHFFGKVRMLIHMSVSLIFVAMITILPSIMIPIDILLTVALIGSFLAWLAYGETRIRRVFHKLRHL